MAIAYLSPELESLPSLPTEKHLSLHLQTPPSIEEPESDWEPSLTPSSTETTEDLLENAISLRLDKFTIFSNLPKDLRYLVWKHALPDPRLIEVEARPLGTCNPFFAPAWTRSGVFFYSEAFEPPALLSVCREAREVALAAFQKCLYTAPNTTPLLDEVLTTNPPIWFQPLRDTVYLTDEVNDGYMSDLIISNLNTFHCESIRFLAIDECVWRKVAEDLVCGSLIFSGDRRRSSWVDGAGYPPPFRDLCDVLLVSDGYIRDGYSLDRFMRRIERRLRRLAIPKSVPTWDTVPKGGLSLWIRYNWPACTYSSYDDNDYY